MDQLERIGTVFYFIQNGHTDSRPVLQFLAWLSIQFPFDKLKARTLLSIRNMGDTESTANSAIRRRELCYEARDVFYGCVDSLRQNESNLDQCKDQSLAYEKLCLRSWRKYWDERRANNLALLKPLKS